jgi:hypothetical protein
MALRIFTVSDWSCIRSTLVFTGQKKRPEMKLKLDEGLSALPIAGFQNEKQFW